MTARRPLPTWFWARCRDKSCGWEQNKKPWLAITRSAIRHSGSGDTHTVDIKDKHDNVVKTLVAKAHSVGDDSF